MANISLRNIRKVYPGGVEVVPNLDLEIQDKEFIILVGPSGCGKSTTLRMIAGLEEITDGELYIGGRLMNDVAPKDRDIAMVFQNYALYPHMNIYKNMAFGLIQRKVPKDEIDNKVRETAKMLDLEHLLERKPKALSGGQRQRVALGRALVRNPSVFLLDEPLSNLDAKLRTQMRTEITKLHKELGTTFVYVTHDQTEAMTMGDRIVVMKDGIIQQVDKPQTLYDKPANLFVAGFIGSPQMNFIDAVIKKTEIGFAVTFDNIVLPLPETKLIQMDTTQLDAKAVVLGIRPENIHCDPVHIQAAMGKTLPVTVELSELMGVEVYIYAVYGKNKLPITIRASAKLNVAQNQNIDLMIDMNEIHLFDKQTGLTLFPQINETLLPSY